MEGDASMKYRNIALSFTLAALLTIIGCGSGKMITYSPLIQPVDTSKPSKEFSEEYESLYKALARQTTVIDNAEDEGDTEQGADHPADVYQIINGTIDGRNDVEWFEAGLKAAGRQQWEESLNAFHKVIWLDSKNTEAYFHRGNIHDELGHYNRAISDYSKAIKLNPAYIDAYLRRGFAYNNLGKVKKALEDLKKAARLGDNTAQKFLKNKGIPW